MKNFFKDNGVNIICMAVCFAAGFVLGAVLAPHHNKIELNLFSGNGNESANNNGNCADFPKRRKRCKKV